MMLVVILTVFVLSYSLYALAWPPTLFWQDAGIYLGAIKSLGIAYPPGFPLYVMGGWLWTQLMPLGNLAQKVHSFSALWGAGTSAILALTACQLLRKDGPFVEGHKRILNAKSYALYAIFIGLTAAFSYSLWAQSINAEVYSLHAFFTAMYLHLLYHLSTENFAFPGQGWQRRRWWGLAIMVGLSFANHPGAVAFLPPLVYLAWQKRKDFLRAKRMVLLMLIVFVIVAFLPYLYLPLRSRKEPALNWGRPDTPERFFRHITGSVYLTEEKAFEGGGWGKVLNFAVLLWQELFLMPLFLGMLGIWRLLKKNKLLLEVLLIYIGVLYLTVYFYAKGGEYNFWLIPVYLTILFLAAEGFLFFQRFFKSLSLFVLLCFLMVLPPLLVNWHYLDRSDYYAAEDFGKNLLRGLTPNSVFFVLGDQPSSTILYLQMVDGYRTDVAAFSVDSLATEYERDVLAKAFPKIEFPEIGGEKTLGELVNEFVKTNNSGHDIYFISLSMVPADFPFPLKACGGYWQVSRDESGIDPDCWDFQFTNPNFMDQPMKPEARKKIDLGHGQVRYEDQTFHQHAGEYYAQAFKNLGDYYYSVENCDQALAAYEKMEEFWPGGNLPEVEEKREECLSKN